MHLQLTVTWCTMLLH